LKRIPKQSRKERFKIRDAQRAEIRRIHDLVVQRLEPHQPRDVCLVVSAEAIAKHGEHWYVVVNSDRPEVSSAAYTNRLLHTEDDLLEHDGLKVMLVSMLPMEDELKYDLPVQLALRG
jgi:hypothetical protein